eukprot:NODE_12_length_54577_cov_0.384100.p9 type:complete len:419 gc:universal NODE_12_length_54577_cov_0.384100:29074-27818(-)
MLFLKPKTRSPFSKMKLDQFLRKNLPQTTTTTQIRKYLFEYEQEYQPIPASIMQSVPSEELDFNLEDFLIILKKVMAQHRVSHVDIHPIPFNQHLIHDTGNISLTQSSFDVLSNSNTSIHTSPSHVNINDGNDIFQLKEELELYKNRENENINEMNQLLNRLQSISQSHYGLTSELQDYKQLESKYLTDLQSHQEKCNSLSQQILNDKTEINQLKLELHESNTIINRLESDLNNFNSIKLKNKDLMQQIQILDAEIEMLQNQPQQSQISEHPFISAHSEPAQMLNKTVSVNFTQEEMNDLNQTIQSKNKELKFLNDKISHLTVTINKYKQSEIENKVNRNKLIEKENFKNKLDSSKLQIVKTHEILNNGRSGILKYIFTGILLSLITLGCLFFRLNEVELAWLYYHIEKFTLQKRIIL